MDILGKQGEEASERLDRVENQIQKLDSHLSAVDNALQDFVDNYSRILEDEIAYHEDELQELKRVVNESSDKDEDIQRIERRVDNLQSQIKHQEEQLDQVIGSDLEKTFSELVTGLKNVKSTVQDTKADVKELEKRVDDVESEVLVEVTNRDFDFEKKLDKREYEEREGELEEEVKKLRASVLFLADELDKKDEIEVE